MKNKKTVFLISIILLAILIVFLPYLKAEILTYRHGEEFGGLEQQIGILDSSFYLKVVDYSDNIAKVFYVSPGKFGCVVTFNNDNGDWKVATWEPIWSHYGSAEEFYWPYYK